MLALAATVVFLPSMAALALIGQRLHHWSHTWAG